VTSKKKYNQLFSELVDKPGQQIQKYHRLLLEGFVLNPSIEIKTITSLPITKSYKKKFVRYQKEEENNIEYNYLSVLNIPVLKNLLIFLQSFFYTFLLCIKNKDSVVICDVLNISVSGGAILATKLVRRKNVGIVTDVPSLLSSNPNSISVKINNLIINRFDSYIFLTEQMNDLININNRPYQVIEGVVDIKMSNIENTIEKKYNKKICIYAGGLQRIYGIKYLVEAFIRADIFNSELHIYGNGDFEEELVEICKVYKNIKYFGVALNDFVVNEQLKATLLINPRPTNEEYTKYSFPSKNMEYMVSGTPILTTKLPGMPKEYYKYIYTIESESVNGLAEELKNILEKSSLELHKKGNDAKDFVLNEKNNVIQASKIIEMVIHMK